MSTADLYRLQLIDSEIDQIRRRVFEIDQALKGSPALFHTRAELEKAEVAAQSAASHYKASELELQALVEKIEHEDKRLYVGSIKNVKEMVEVQAELESLKRRRGVIEDKLLEEMERLDTLRADEARCRAALRQAEVNFKSDSASMTTERQQIVNSVLGRAEQRTALINTLAKPALEHYQQLRKKNTNGTAVALIRNGACGACGEEVSSGIAQQAHTGQNIALCSNCGRILYAS